jgi:outer membrane biosynthesis protein TonB
LAFQDELADLRERAPTQALNQQSLTEGGETAALPQADTERLVGGAQQTSGGIQSAQGPTTQQALGGRDTTRVTRPDGPGGGASGRRERDTGGRSLASIQAVFDRNKGALYTLYNRALRRDPSLEGRVVIKLTIAPSGKVTDIRLVSNGLDNDRLVHQIIDRIRLFDFGEADVKATTLEYPLDFMPS